MEKSLGYIKDCAAFIGFIICFFIIYFIPNIQFLKPIILLVLLIGVIVDGIFTFYPTLHTKNVF